MKSQVRNHENIRPAKFLPVGPSVIDMPKRHTSQFVMYWCFQGFSVEGMENLQEIRSNRLYLCQFLCALSILRTGETSPPFFWRFWNKMASYNDFSYPKRFFFYTGFREVKVRKKNDFEKIWFSLHRENTWEEFFLCFRNHFVHHPSQCCGYVKRLKPRRPFTSGTNRSSNSTYLCEDAKLVIHIPRYSRTRTYLTRLYRIIGYIG